MGGVETCENIPMPEVKKSRKIAADLYGYDPSWVIMANGSDELLNNLIRAFAGEEDEIGYVNPSYSYYGPLAEIQGAKIRTFGLTEDHRIADFPEIYEARSSFSPAPQRSTRLLLQQCLYRRTGPPALQRDTGR